VYGFVASAVNHAAWIVGKPEVDLRMARQPLTTWQRNTRLDVYLHCSREYDSAPTTNRKDHY
jgi:hypothetical protein